MKKALILFLVLSFFPISSSAFESPLRSEPGSAGNPINVTIEPTQSYKNDMLEDALKEKYGSSEYYSCMNRIPSCSVDMSDPRNQTACLQTIQYNFDTGRCGKRATPSLTCQSGFVMVDGSCVRESNTEYIKFPILPQSPGTQQGPTCGEGTLLVNDQCVSYTESCRISFGAHAYGDKDNCYCETGYQWTSDMESCEPSPVETAVNNGPMSGGGGSDGRSGGAGFSSDLESCDRKVLGETTHFGMLTPEQCYTVWQAAVEEATASYIPVTETVASPQPAEQPQADTPEPTEQTELVALANWGIDTTVDNGGEDPAPQRERAGFWSWFFGLFGF